MKNPLTLALAVTCFVSPLSFANTNLLADNSHTQADLHTNIQLAAQNSYRKYNTPSEQRKRILKRYDGNRFIDEHTQKIYEFLKTKHQLIENFTAGTNTDTEKKALDFYKKGQFIQAYQTLDADLLEFAKTLKNSDWYIQNFKFKYFQWPIEYQFESSQDYLNSFHTERYVSLQHLQQYIAQVTDSEEKESAQYVLDFYSKLGDLLNRHNIHTSTPDEERILRGLKQGFSPEYAQAMEAFGFDWQKIDTANAIQAVPSLARVFDLSKI